LHAVKVVTVSDGFSSILRATCGVILAEVINPSFKAIRSGNGPAASYGRTKT
jgi:hypothetical protein